MKERFSARWRRRERSEFVSRRSPIVVACGVALALVFCCCPNAQANYFPADSFGTYRSNGVYPLWSENWVNLDSRVHVDTEGIPVVRYQAGEQYNPVTVSLFALRAYNDFARRNDGGDKAHFLKLANWLVAHQEPASGCWFYDFDFEHASVGVTIRRHWISAMAQGLAISVMARAYSMTQDAAFLQSAERALLPFAKDVEDGGVAREFALAGTRKGSSAPLVFFEEYPTRPVPSFTLNGFMFGLLGLYDLAQQGNGQAEKFFVEGMQTLEQALPFFDMGNGTAYDLSHLTRPPRGVHADSGYHLIHITLLNALGTATGSRTLLWYRDHWNSYGSRMGTELIFLQRVGNFAAKRYWGAALATFVVLAVCIVWVLGRWRRIAGWTDRSRQPDAHAALPAAGISQR
jgi:heparosan-N-sulfate-glucuronate 5-epimerase